MKEKIMEMIYDFTTDVWNVSGTRSKYVRLPEMGQKLPGRPVSFSFT